VTSDALDFIDNQKIFTLVLANLAVRRERRGRGIAKELVRACEIIARDWGYESISLLVDSENKAARKLYSKMGYKTVFRDDSATCILPGDYNLRTAECINFCLQKNISKKSNIGIEKLGSLFSELFQ